MWSVFYAFKSIIFVKEGWRMNTAKYLEHTRLTRVSSIRFLLFEIKRFLVYNSIIIYLTDLFILYIFIQNAYAKKKDLRKKANKLYLMGQIVIESESFL